MEIIRKVFCNKKNKQWSISLPKKEIEKKWKDTPSLDGVSIKVKIYKPVLKKFDKVKIGGVI